MIFRTRNTLHLALDAALASRQPALLLHLSRAHGQRTFARALARWHIRKTADALSLLPQREQSDIFQHLPVATQTLLAQMGISGFELGGVERRTSIFERFRRRISPIRPSKKCSGAVLGNTAPGSAQFK